MANPVLVEVTRDTHVESRHRASVVVALPTGERILSLGDVEQSVFPRSAVKAIQAMPLLSAGGADKFQLSNAEIALMCSSHNGEPEHVDTARAILAKAGTSDASLECGAHWPREEFGYALAAEGRRPDALHNACSGKHAGMIALAAMLGEDSAGYVNRSHPVQQHMAEVIEAVFGAPLEEAPCAVDGCSVPTWAFPLEAMAKGFARFARGEGLSEQHAAAAARIRDAMVAAPYMVAGSGRFCTGVMERTGARAFVKTGAEGVVLAALPERNIGIAVKCDDGADRAAEVIMAHLLVQFGAVDADDTAFDRFLTVPLRNWNNIHVGDVRATPELTEGAVAGSTEMIA